MRGVMVIAVLLVGMVGALTMVALERSQAAGGDKGQFKGQCQPSGNSKNDPIVKPAANMEHDHNFWGNKGVPRDENVDTVGELEDAPTSCEDGTTPDPNDNDGGRTRNNRSSYWMPQPYINGNELVPVGSGFYYSSKAGLEPKDTKVTPFGLKLIAKHASIAPSPNRAAEIDMVCPAGSLDQAELLPDGRNTVPGRGDCKAGQDIDIGITFPECLDPDTLGQGAVQNQQIAYRAKDRGKPNARCGEGLRQIPTLQAFFTYKIPSNAGTYGGIEDFEVAGMHGTKVSFENIHADYFNAEDLEREVAFCIKQEMAGDPECK